MKDFGFSLLCHYLLDRADWYLQVYSHAQYVLKDTQLGHRQICTLDNFKPNVGCTVDAKLLNRYPAVVLFIILF
jgi:hypothetical protein